MESQTTADMAVMPDKPRDRPKTIMASHVFLRRAEQILVLRRINSSYMNGQYCLPGGHVEPGETASEAAVRETLEECGALVSKQNLQFCGVMHRFAAGQPLARLELFYECRVWAGSVTIGESNRFDDLRWISIESPPSNVVPFIAAAINALQGIAPWYREFDWPNRVDGQQ